ADPEVVRTRPRLYVVAASVIVLGHDRKPASTAITDEKAGEEVRGGGPAACEQPLSGLQSTLDGVPNPVVNKPQRGDHAGLPLISRSPPVDASPGLGMLSPFPTIEVEPTHIFRVLQHQIDRIWAPNAIPALEIEPFRNGFLAESLAEHLKDLAHNSGFCWIDCDPIAGRDRPTVGIP